MPYTMDNDLRWLVLPLAAVTALLGIVQFARLTALAIQISGMSGAPSWWHLLLRWEWPDQVLWTAPIACAVGGTLAFLRWRGWFGRALVAVATLALVVAAIVAAGEWGWSSRVQQDPLSGPTTGRRAFCAALALMFWPRVGGRDRPWSGEPADRWNPAGLYIKKNGGRNRDRTYDLCDVNAALVPTELCAPGPQPASVSAVDDTSASARPPGRFRPRRPAGSSCRLRVWAAWRSLMVTSTRSTPSQLWHTRLNDSGRTI